MPRPFVDRVQFSVRMRRPAHAALVKWAKAEGLSLNEAMERAVLMAAGKPQPSTPRKTKAVSRNQVTPRFKGKP